MSLTVVMVICLDPNGIFWEKTCKVLCSGLSEATTSLILALDFLRTEKKRPFSIFSTVEFETSSVLLEEISFIKSQRL